MDSRFPKNSRPSFVEIRPETLLKNQQSLNGFPILPRKISDKSP